MHIKILQRQCEERNQKPSGSTCKVKQQKDTTTTAEKGCGLSPHICPRLLLSDFFFIQ